MTIRLRAHHLLCMLTYVGRGYSPAFTANFDVIAGRLSRGEAIEIVAGPDDVCAPLLNEAEPHCHRESVLARDALAAEAVGEALGSPIAPGVRLTLDGEMLAQMRQAFAERRTRAACSACDWRELCDGIAENGFEKARVVVEAPSGRPRKRRST